MTINLFDIVFLILLGSFTLLSYLKGAMKELFGLVGLAGGYVAAHWYAPSLAGMLEPLLPDANGAELLSFAVIMMAGYFVGTFLGGFSDLFRNSAESALSRLLGAGIGFFKGLVLALALYSVIESYIPAFQDEMSRSWIAGRLAELMAYFQRMNLI